MQYWREREKTEVTAKESRVWKSEGWKGGEGREGKEREEGVVFI